MTGAPTAAGTQAPTAPTLAPCVELRRNPFVLLPELATPASRFIHAFPALLAAQQRVAEAHFYAYWIYRDGHHPYGGLRAGPGEGPRQLGSGEYGTRAVRRVGEQGRVYRVSWERLQCSQALIDQQGFMMGRLANLVEVQRKRYFAETPYQPGPAVDHPLDWTAAEHWSALRKYRDDRQKSVQAPPPLSTPWLPLPPSRFNFYPDLQVETEGHEGRPFVPSTGPLLFGACLLNLMVRGTLTRRDADERKWFLELKTMRWEIMDEFSFEEGEPRNPEERREAALRRAFYKLQSDREIAQGNVLPAPSRGPDGRIPQPLGTWTLEGQLSVPIAAPLEAPVSPAPKPLPASSPLVQLNNQSFRDFAFRVAQAFNELRVRHSCTAYPGAMVCTSFWVHSVSPEKPFTIAIGPVAIGPPGSP